MNNSMKGREQIALKTKDVRTGKKAKVGVRAMITYRPVLTVFTFSLGPRLSRRLAAEELSQQACDGRSD